MDFVDTRHEDLPDQKAEGCFFNGDNSDYRVTFSLANGGWFVVKFNDKIGYSTLKIWHGDMNKTTSQWKTKPINYDQKVVNVALSKIRDFNDDINALKTEYIK